jgi:hypothetical protein
LVFSAFAKDLHMASVLPLELKQPCAAWTLCCLQMLSDPAQVGFNLLNASVAVLAQV